MIKSYLFHNNGLPKDYTEQGDIYWCLQYTAMPFQAPLFIQTHEWYPF